MGVSSLSDFIRSHQFFLCSFERDKSLFSFVPPSVTHEIIPGESSFFCTTYERIPPFSPRQSGKGSFFFSSLPFGQTGGHDSPAFFFPELTADCPIEGRNNT